MNEQPPADDCAHTPRGGRRLGPSLHSPSYQLTVNGNDLVLRARLDVATSADRVHHLATALTPAGAA